MLTAELRVNGVLIEVILITNIGFVESSEETVYKFVRTFVGAIEPQKVGQVIHDPKDGAGVLVRKVLEARDDHD